MIDTAKENAIHAWVVAASQLAAERIIWSEQAGPRPAGPHVSLQVMDVRQRGQAAVTVRDAPSPTPGAEIEHAVGLVGRATLSVQVFAGVSGGAPTAPDGARSIADRLRTRSWLPSIRTALNEAGVGILSFGSVTSLPGMAGGLFEARATLTVELALTAQASETGTIIETVELTREQPVPVETFEVTS